MLTVNHITFLISINWITGSKRYYLNWFFSKETWQENVNAWIFLHASLKQDWLLTKGDSCAELILAPGCLQVSVLHKNLYRILKRRYSVRQLQLKADTHPRPPLLCGLRQPARKCIGALLRARPINGGAPRQWVTRLAAEGNWAVPASAVTRKSFLLTDPLTRKRERQGLPGQDWLCGLNCKIISWYAVLLCIADKTWLYDSQMNRIALEHNQKLRKESHSMVYVHAITLLNMQFRNSYLLNFTF